MKRNMIMWAVLVATLFVGSTAFAHHGTGLYYGTGTVTLKGTVTKWIYANPHLLLMLDVKGENGELVHWVLETQSPTVMYPSGYRKDSFKPGDQVSVTAGLAKSGLPVGRIIDAVTADGTKLGRFSPSAGQQ